MNVTHINVGSFIRQFVHNCSKYVNVSDDNIFSKDTFVFF